MARLSHPNVVVVHDVAMDFVEGRTLRAWLAERRRSLAEIAAAFVEAGRGLHTGRSTASTRFR